MPAIADQVATMEHDHAAALAQIDELTSSRDALKAALASVTNENLLLREQNQALTDFANETRATVETLAIGTMELLRASRRPVGGQPASKVLPFAPKPKPEPLVPDMAAIAAMTAEDGRYGSASDLLPAQAEINAAHAPTPAEPAQSDSGDEQPNPSSDNGSSPDSEHGGSTPSEGATVPVNEFSRPSLAPTRVVHDDNDLPIFLTRDRPFINAADRAIFG